jgi:hypothetical protein
MRLRPWLIASFGLNLILAAAWYIADLQEDNFAPVPAPRVSFAARKVITNSVVRRITFTWAEIADTNLATYITGLRNMGCPEGTIRDIILAEVNQAYARRRATEVVTPDQQWWLSVPDPVVASTAHAQLLDLETGRRALLTSLLGANWETDTDQLAWLISNYGLTGPQLGDLPPETKRAVYDIATRTAEALRGQNAMEAARIRAGERVELTNALPAATLNEYLLRYSQTAQRLRDLARGVALSPEQFQQLFAAIDPIAMQPALYYQGDDPELRQQQRAWQSQYDLVLRQGLGDAAFTALQLNQDPLYTSARDAVQQTGLPERALKPLYEINRATQAELNRIRNDPTLANGEKISALEATRVEEEKSIEQLIGSEAFKRWLQTQVRP